MQGDGHTHSLTHISSIFRDKLSLLRSLVYVNKVGGGEKKFKSFEEMKQHMVKEAENNKRTNAGESSEEDEDDDL